MRIDHAYVETRDFDRTLAFWNALGFAARESWGEAGHRACLLGRGEARVVLAECGYDAPQRATVHFDIRELDALAAAIAASAAVEIETPLGPTHWGTRWLRVRDPDGNVWAFEAL